ncbi:MAG: dephospho-CoA kinase [Gammaproteobacteria bacterium]|nr:dephospho-CoA kinase [Gammaproteobacteria bacterium]
MTRRIIGLTGGIGSGKSAAADRFAEKGIDLVDADLLAREVVEPGTEGLLAIEAHFGSSILTAEGTLDRAQLRSLIFAAPDEKAWLENLLHPLINRLMRARLSAGTSPYCLLVSPLLLETEQAQLVDRVLVIDVLPETQLSRTLSRDGSSRETIEAIIASQIDRETRLARADDVISNEDSIEALHRAVDSQHEKYLQWSRGQQ